MGLPDKMTAKPGRRQRRHRLGAWLGFVALLFQMSIPLGQGMSAAAMADGDASDVLPPLVICDAMGGVMEIAGGGLPGETSGQPAPCVFCLVCCQVRSFSQDFLPASVMALPLPEITAWSYPGRFANIASTIRPASRHLPRAPPSFT